MKKPGIPQSDRLQRLQQDLQTGGAEALRVFWDEMARLGTPIIEPGSTGENQVTFVWRNDAATVDPAVIQDWGADGIREHFMSRLPGSDVWYLSRWMASDTRTTYQFSPSYAASPGEPPYRLDPLNPKTYTAYLSEGGSNILFSLLELPDAPALPWRQSSPPRAAAVELYTPFADGRRLWVYLPPQHTTDALPLLVVFDGRLYKDSLRLPEMLDYLIGSGQIPPTAALMVDNADRTELLGRPEFADYIANQVMPWVRATCPVAQDAQRTILAGSSYGGLAAAYIAFRHPTVFGTVLSQTGWYRWRPDGDPQHHWLARQFAAAPRLPLRFWLQVGSLETARMLDGGPSQLDANRHMRDTLQVKGYATAYQEYSGGHDASSLEFPLAQALIEILAAHPEMTD
jgi:enterochelin esterase family protein